MTSISFDADDDGKPISVSWTQVTPENNTIATRTISGLTTFTHLIDASGRAGLISTKYLKNRHFNASLKNIAVWGYWSECSDREAKGGMGTYGKGTVREGAPWFEALKDESGWAWFIPLHNGKTSVGIVMNQEQYNAQAKTRSTLVPGAFESSSLTQRYLANLHLAPGVVKLLSGKNVGVAEESEESEEGSLNFRVTLEPGSVRSASDFSYSAPSYAGSGYRIVGDAGGKQAVTFFMFQIDLFLVAFIDPFFSSGIHLAFTGALSAAATICASIRNDCTEDQAAAWHTKRVQVSYTR